MRSPWSGAIGPLANGWGPFGERCANQAKLDLRMIETIVDGKSSTSFMRFGGTVRIEMTDAQLRPIFGAIEQEAMR